jgi:A/G-specific adenine glycosylase
MLEPIGLQQQRARELVRLADYLTTKHDSRVPSDLVALLGVPGVGPYTARAVLSFAFDQPYAIVDSNVVRVVGRVFRAAVGEKPTIPTVQVISDQILPNKEHRIFNLAMLDLGAEVCRYSRPLCHECPLRLICDTAE